jgi:branched-subunit amino acid aminotransferase/4-amino-4-deoxychorismate lyase
MSPQGSVPDDRPHLIETMRAERGEALRLSAHMARMGASARALGLVFAEEAMVRDLDATARTSDGPGRLRVELSPDGSYAITLQALPRSSGSTPVVIIASQRLHSGDPLLAHKTNRRAVYEAGRAAIDAVEGGFDAIFLNERDEVCEGGISNVFAEIGGQLLTPPLASGLLPGIMRAEVIATRGARETVIRVADLERAETLYCTNAVRGVTRVVLKAAANG